MEKFLYAKFEDNVIPSELEVYEFTRTDGAMVLTGQSKLKFIGSVIDAPPPAFKLMEMPPIPAAIAPIVAPNPAPGKEVKVEYHTPAMPGDTIKLPEQSGNTIKFGIEPPNRKKGHDGPTEEQLEARRILAKMDPTILARAAGEDVVGAAEADDNATTITHHADGSATVVHELPKRKRCAKAAVDAPAEPVGEPTDFKLSEAAAPEASEQLPIPESAYYAVPEKPVIEGLPTPEELKGFRTRLFNLTSEVLSKGGMVPTEGIGGVNAKVRLFVATLFPGITDLKYLTKEQWDTFLNFVESDSYTPESLVAYIHGRIGVKE